MTARHFPFGWSFSGEDLAETLEQFLRGRSPWVASPGHKRGNTPGPSRNRSRSGQSGSLGRSRSAWSTGSRRAPRRRTGRLWRGRLLRRFRRSSAAYDSSPPGEQLCVGQLPPALQGVSYGMTPA